MLKRVEKYLFLIITIAVFTSCKKNFEGDVNTQSLPETYMVVDKIDRTGDARYTTTIEAHWWGASNIGIIKGYEVSVDNQQTWTYTTKQSDLFKLELPAGHDTADIVVYVRAIDNLGQKDPTPASTAFPVKNSPPQIAITFIAGKKPATSFPAVKFFWNASDPDGIQDIIGFEIYLNDTTLPPFIVPSRATDIALVANVSGAVFTNDCDAYVSYNNTPLSGKVKGILYDALNKFYIRAVDKTGAKSKWAKDSVYIKKPKSDVLLVNAFQSSSNVVLSFYANQFSQIGIANYDTLSAKSTTSGSQTNYQELSPDYETQSRVFSLFKKIVWVSDDTTSILLAQASLTPFFNNGGKLFMSISLSDDYQYDPISYAFTPIESFVYNGTNTKFRINTNSEITPYNASSGWPTLKSEAIIAARPFITFSTASGVFSYDSVYKASLIDQGAGVSWNGPSNVISARKKVATGKTDLLFITMPLHKLNGNNNMNAFLQRALITELEF